MRLGFIGSGTAPQAVAASVVLAATLATNIASGHAGPPRAVGVVIAPHDPDLVLVRTTYGMVLTRDGGASFGWLCGAGAGFDAQNELPHGVIFGDGSLAVATFAGLGISADGCDWRPADGEVGAMHLAELTRGSAADVAFGVHTNGLGGYMFEVDVWRTQDAGRGWERLGTRPPADFLAFGLRVAISDSKRVVLAGRDGTVDDLSEVVMRSDDGGESWQRLLLSGRADAITTIAAMDPEDADVFYISSVMPGDAPSFRLYRTSNGSTFDTVFETQTRVTSVALSPDGKTIAVGAEDGLWMADTNALDFEHRSQLSVQCLRWTDAGIYACADESVDGFTVGLSRDEGASFEAFMHLDSPCDVLACDDGTSVATMCPAAWALEKVELGVDCNEGAAQGGGGPSPEAAPSGCATSSEQPSALRVLPIWLGGIIALAWRRRVSAP